MSNILDKIIAHKLQETAARKEQISISELEKSIPERSIISLKESIKKTESGIIAEFKRRSPSKGLINGTALPSEVPAGYLEAGVAGVSILTDEEFFGGTNEDLKTARSFAKGPILRKDFTVEEYNVVEARAIGADAILLIAAALEPKQLKNLAKLAKELGLEVLMEIHNKEELNRSINEYVDLVGVNNRNLKTFEVSINTSIELEKAIPNEFLKVSESGISNPKTILELREIGFSGFLIGENFMKTNNPIQACKEFVSMLKNLG
ncbi:indole-3-glycerol phosphate synthase TrpC [Flammeovirgaceae bacterium SG7u.111]|nr:indole-3-glycerol phosphate synthase TrpC [Flammeovirgaceae bacterium SG7u.132]WPO35369.1 indole-3-glycerol phosphate synthase TrpC [Flammeovirgaceae bacterium SG7u.111]